MQRTIMFWRKEKASASSDSPKRRRLEKAVLLSAVRHLTGCLLHHFETGWWSLRLFLMAVHGQKHWMREVNLEICVVQKVKET